MLVIKLIIENDVADTLIHPTTLTGCMLVTYWDFSSTFL